MVALPSLSPPPPRPSPSPATPRRRPPPPPPPHATPSHRVRSRPATVVSAASGVTDGYHSTIRSLNSRGRHVPRKSLGQNYMLNSKVNEELVAAAGVEEGDVVLEIGPGTGSLTAALLDAGATVFAVEKDKHMATLVNDRFGSTEQLKIIEEDITKFNVRSHLLPFLEEKSHHTRKYAKVVSNLPFNVSTEVVKLLLPMGDVFSVMVLLLQDETALRFADASIQTPEYRPINVFVNFYSEPEYKFKVERTNFFPQPKVDGAVISFKLKNSGDYPPVNSAFNGKRKMLRKSLQHLCSSSEIEAALANIGLPVTLTLPVLARFSPVVARPSGFSCNNSGDGSSSSPTGHCRWAHIHPAPGKISTPIQLIHPHLVHVVAYKNPHYAATDQSPLSPPLRFSIRRRRPNQSPRGGGDLGFPRPRPRRLSPRRRPLLPSSIPGGLRRVACPKMRPVFCGNLDYDARQSEIERLFSKYGRVERDIMEHLCSSWMMDWALPFLPEPRSSLVHLQELRVHPGICSLGNNHLVNDALLLRSALHPPLRCTLLPRFAFVYMEDERDADEAIHRLDRIEFGRKGRRLRVEWTKEDRSGGRRGNSKRSPNNTRPTKTLFVINFDPINTRTRDLERHFDQYGKISNVRIRRNFAFVQYELQEDATKALEGTNGSTLMDRVISVEYALRDDDEKRNGYSPERRGRDRSPDRRDYRGRSASPYGRGRERGSPDYGRGRERGSPDYGRGGDRGSPDYHRGASPQGGNKGDERGSPPNNYDRERREASPGYDGPRSRSPARYERE
uniref:rRNA adenine N(6)-methyltransferase n=1 Tax=Oryza barthii TaxID=65489 RepID=A0A0D3F004_9ORYZ